MSPLSERQAELKTPSAWPLGTHGTRQANIPRDIIRDRKENGGCHSWRRSVSGTYNTKAEETRPHSFHCSHNLKLVIAETKPRLTRYQEALTE